MTAVLPDSFPVGINWALLALPSPHRAAAPVKTPKVGVPDKQLPADPAAILRRGWHNHPAGRAAAESIARLGRQARQCGCSWERWM